MLEALVVVLNKSLTLKVFAHWSFGLQCVRWYVIHQTSQQSIATERGKTESHSSRWNSIGHFWSNGAVCECSNDGNVTVSNLHHMVFPPGPCDVWMSSSRGKNTLDWGRIIACCNSGYWLHELWCITLPCATLLSRGTYLNHMHYFTQSTAYQLFFKLQSLLSAQNILPTT